MGLIEVIALCIFALIVINVIWRIFFSKKKGAKKADIKKAAKTNKKEAKADKPKTDKAKDKDSDKQAKVEPVQQKAIKEAEKQPEPKQEPEKELTLEKKEKEEEKKGLRVIRKKTELIISKTALKNGSRNPSVTKVFDKNGKLVQDEETKPAEPEEQMHVTDIKKPKEKEKVERFGTREYEYSEENTPEFFQINAPKGSPLRSPIIGDRTNFTEHLHVSEDGNLSGISGIGVHKVVASASSQADAIEQKNQEMLARVDQSLHDPDFGDLLHQYDSFNRQKQEKTVGQKMLEKLDPETLILADAINNPRHKKKHNTDHSDL